MQKPECSESMKEAIFYSERKIYALFCHKKETIRLEYRPEL